MYSGARRKPYPSGQDLQHALAEDETLPLRLHLQDLEDEVLLSHAGRVLDLEVAGDVGQLRDRHVLEGPDVEALLALGFGGLRLDGLLLENDGQPLGVGVGGAAASPATTALRLGFWHDRTPSCGSSLQAASASAMAARISFLPAPVWAEKANGCSPGASSWPRRVEAWASAFAAHPVGLGHDQEQGLAGTAHELDQVHIERRGRDPRVDQTDHEPESVLLQEVRGDVLAPRLPLLPPGAGVPVPGEIDEVAAVVDEIVVERPGLPRGLGNGGQTRSEQAVEQARLPNVRAAGERDLREWVPRALPVVRHRGAQGHPLDSHARYW